MDTPDRERGLWIGDVADQASYLFYSMDKPGRDLLKKAIKVTLAFSDSETGIFAGLGPGRFRELPAQSLQFIEQGIWHYYYNTGDRETLADCRHGHCSDHDRLNGGRRFLLWRSTGISNDF